MRVQLSVLLVLTIIVLSADVPAVTPTKSDRPLASPQTTECTLIPVAQILLARPKVAVEQPKWMSAMQAANYGHEVVAGRASVLSIRQFTGAAAAVDAAKFLKMTLALSSTDLETLGREPIEIPVSEGFYVSGGVGFLHKLHYWHAVNPALKINVSRDANGLNVTLHSSFSAEFAASGESKQVTLDIRCRAREKIVETLDTWDGKPGSSFESFAPPGTGKGDGG